MKDLISQETTERVKRDNCFDFLRYFFAFSLILVHFCTLTNQEQFWFVTGQMRVKAFFTITGFLVVYSFLRRNSLKVYCWKRVYRIVPAYVVTILLCFFIGFFFSTASIKEYFLSQQSLKYLAANLSFMNFIEPSLPGLFTNNCYGSFVNGSLWSMKYEVLFYIAVPFMIFLMRKVRKIYVLAVVFIILTIYNQYHDNSMCTIIYFFSGTAILLYFDRFCKHVKWIFPCCILHFCLTLFYDYAFLYYIEPLVFSAIIVAVAYYCKPLNFLQRYDNISYGLYLYHFPVIQVLVQYKLHQYNIYLTFILSLLITVTLAVISWYMIEKPMLRRKIV